MEDEASLCLPEYNSREQITYQKPFPFLLLLFYLIIFAFSIKDKMSHFKEISSAVQRILCWRAHSPESGV